VGHGVEPATFSPIASVAGFSADMTTSSASMATSFVASWNTTGLAQGFYTLRFRVSDDLGNSTEDRVGIWVFTATPLPRTA
jgi:hypothetical protein